MQNGDVGRAASQDVDIEVSDTVHEAIRSLYVEDKGKKDHFKLSYTVRLVHIDFDLCKHILKCRYALGLNNIHQLRKDADITRCIG